MLGPEVRVHGEDGGLPGHGLPAVHDGDAAGLEGTMDLAGAVEARGREEDDADVGEGVGEEVVIEGEVLAALVRDADGPGVGGGVGCERVEEGLVDVGGVDLDGFGGRGGGEDEACYGSRAAGVVVDDGAGGDRGDEGEVVLGELLRYLSSGGFVGGDFGWACEERAGLRGYGVLTDVHIGSVDLSHDGN